MNTKQILDFTKLIAVTAPDADTDEETVEVWECARSMAFFSLGILADILAKNYGPADAVTDVEFLKCAGLYDALDTLATHHDDEDEDDDDLY